MLFDNLDDLKPRLVGPDGRALEPETKPAQVEHRIEVVRSFSFKLNLGNYENADFFCSVKDSCDPEDFESVSADLSELAMDEVRKSMAIFKQARKEKGLAA